MTDASIPDSTSAPDTRSTTTRRELLEVAGTGLALGALSPWTAGAAGAVGVHSQGSQRLRVGLIGCGGRGRGAALNALLADPQAELVALGDTFADRIAEARKALAEHEAVGARVSVGDEGAFTGFDAYRGVIDACDVVLLATPPHFRPAHVAAAVAAGKHLFVEKPVATDAPGLRSVLESARLAAEKGLNLVSGLCYRYQNAKRETLRRVHEGEIGEILALQCSYNTGGLWHLGTRDEHPEWSEMEYQIRNWLYFTWLSGDHVVEQHIHSLDKVLWAMGDVPPARCTASGGRSVRTEDRYGNVYDHFNAVFDWAGGARAFSSCRQWPGAATDVSDHVFGTRGTARLQTHQIEGENPWRWRSDEPDDMYQNEHDALFRALRAGDVIDDSDYMCKSTLMAIMVRMSAYTGEAITWEQALASQQDLSPPAYEWGELETRPVARPGETKFL